MPLNQTFTDDFGREFSLQLWHARKVSVVAHGVAHIFEGDAAERIATYMRGMDDACEEALRQQVEEEMVNDELLVYNEHECEFQTPAIYAEWCRELAYESEHRRQESRQDIFL